MVTKHPGIARPCSWPTSERITRNFGEKMFTGAVFLDVAKAFDTVWFDGLLCKLTLLCFPSYIVHTISSYLKDRTFEASFQTATSSRRGMRAGVPQGGLISPVLFSLYVNDMPSPSHHVSDLQRWLSEWRIAINVSKSTAIIFARAGLRFIQPRLVTLFGEPIRWVDTTRYLGLILYTQLAWLPHMNQVRKRAIFNLRLSQSGLRTQTANQPKFIPPIISPGQLTP